MFYQLQHIFGSLSSSTQQFYRPTNFTEAFKGYDGESINVSEQMDVDEFFKLLMDKLENVLKS